MLHLLAESVRRRRPLPAMTKRMRAIEALLAGADTCVRDEMLEYLEGIVREIYARLRPSSWIDLEDDDEEPDLEPTARRQPREPLDEGRRLAAPGSRKKPSKPQARAHQLQFAFVDEDAPGDATEPATRESPSEPPT